MKDSAQIPPTDSTLAAQPDADAPVPGVDVQVCIVTGLSGADKSTALKVFEDMGHFVVDGLPVSLVMEMVDMMSRPSMSHFKGIALGMDLRQSNFVEDINDCLSMLAGKNIRPMLLFLEANNQELIRRYASTRRPHPLEREGMGLEAALLAERSSLRPLREMADLVIDTSRFSIHDLRRGKLRAIRVNVISFGFKYGVPREADLVFDLRFLANPYFVDELRPMSGKDKPVADYVFNSPHAREYRDKLVDLLFFMLPLMEAEGRYRITVAVGCTGGRHRSVAMAEEILQALRQADYPAFLEHRHLELG